MRSGAWVGVPGGVRAIVGAQVVVLGYGAVVHVVQLVAGGLTPYPWAPGWLAAYFTALTVLDPLAAVLLLTRRAAGLYLGLAILVTDAVANGYAAYVLAQGGVLPRVSQAVISVLALTAVATAPQVRPWLTPTPRGVRGGRRPAGPAAR